MKSYASYPVAIIKSLLFPRRTFPSADGSVRSHKKFPPIQRRQFLPFARDDRKNKGQTVAAQTPPRRRGGGQHPSAVADSST
ncbi:hypothetical protein L596_003485 [Steinernema carpocapsae]|uniref:Uncharacterized protein n=1 Tax=Steinernema carpocapsae TaxID=34508 RepID=A0A4U8UWR8_STECR|nr:hypothetical protein L596_003485 [Steinernema carpocapsae]